MIPMGCRSTGREGTVTNPYRYAGYRWDAETGFYYLNARYYWADVGRFITRDTFTGSESQPLSLNLYNYVSANPIKYYDPDGHYAKDISEDFFMTMRRNGLEAKKRRFWALYDKLLWFRSMVGYGKTWDHKLKLGVTTYYRFFGKSRTGEDLGNIHYGYVGKALWLGDFILLSAAGLAGVLSPKGTWNASDWRTYFDDPRDQAMIKEGFQWYIDNQL